MCLTYVTARGRWYDASWKGFDERSECRRYRREDLRAEVTRAGQLQDAAARAATRPGHLVDHLLRNAVRQETAG